jgi:hypothetical protein
MGAVMGLADWFRATFPPEPYFDHFDGPPRQQFDAAGTDLRRLQPRLATVREAPSREEWAAWRDDPTTLFVMAALKRNAEECQEQWARSSWEGGKADQRMLDGLRERSDALLGFTGNYDAFCETLGLEPDPIPEEEA